jgi:endonuclease III-like uncharacterized protein
MAEQSGNQDRVNIVDDTTGEIASIPASQMPLAISEGYRPETDKEGTIRRGAAEYDSIAGQAQLFAEGAAGELTLGISDVGAEALRTPEQRAAFEKAIENNQLAYYGGRATGFAASLLYGGPIAGTVFKGAQKAGVAVGAKAAGLVGSKIESELAKKVVESSARMATEGAIIAAPKAAMELAFSEHPEHAAESVLTGAVLGGLIGATIPVGQAAYRKADTALAGTAKKLLRKAGIAEDKAIATAEGKVGSAEAGALAAEEATGDIVASDLAQGQTIAMLKQELQQKPANYADLMAAQQRLGIEQLPTAMASGSQIVKNTESLLGQSPTIAGRKVRAEYDALNEQMIQAVEREVVGSTERLSKAQLGRKAREDIVEELTKRSKYFEQAYGDIEKKTANLYVDDAARLEARERLINSQKILENRGDAWAEQVVKESEKILRKESVQALQTQRSTLSNEIQKAIRTGDGNLASGLRSVRDELDQLIESSIKAGGEAPLYSQWKKIQGEYSEFKEFMKQLGDTAGLGSAKTRMAQIIKLGEKEPEQLVNSIFNMNKSEKLQFVKENLPGSFKEFQKYKLAQLREDALNNEGVVRVGRFAEEALSLPEDALKTFYTPKQLEVLKDVYTLSQQVPRQFPNSNTAVAQEFQELLSIKGLTNQVRDAILYKVLRGSQKDPRQIMLMAGAKNEAQSIAAKAGLAIEDLASGKVTKPRSDQALMAQEFKAQQEALTGPMPNYIRKDQTRVGFQGFVNRLKEIAADPTGLANSLKNGFGAVDQSLGGRVLPALQWQAQKALHYLIDQAPKPLTPPNPLNPKPHNPSDTELHKYKRKVEATLNPFIILDKLRDGSLTQDEMVTVATVYPNQLQLMRTSVLDALATNKQTIPYAARMKISLFLGHPIEPTLEPLFIKSMQATYAQEQQQAQPQKFESNIAERTTLGRMNRA